MDKANSDNQDAAGIEALRHLESGRRFLICGHERPDGDCVGSQAALAQLLSSRGAEVRVLNPGPLEPKFDFLARECRYETFAGGELPEHDTCVLLDLSELSRTGPMAEPIRRAASNKIVVDHHLFTGTAWWDAAFRDPSASATGLLVFRIGKALGAQLDRAGAEGVFTSLATDTGWFRHGNTDAETFDVAAELVRLGVDPSALFRSVFQRSTPGHPRALGSALRRLQYHADGRLAVVDWPGHWVSDEEVIGSLDDTGALFDLLRSVERVEVAIFLRELEDGSCKLSARSKSVAFDVQALAARFGGGGHRSAAGAKVEGTLDVVRDRVVAVALEELFGGPAARSVG